MAEVEVITIKQMEAFDKMLLEHPEMKRKVHKVLSSVLQKARSAVSKDAHAAFPHDPRQSYRAIKRVLYKRLLGGNISLYNKRRASNTRVRLEKERKLRPGQRGGNRRKRSEKTERIDSYFGSDNAFKLRWLDQGTATRAAYTMSSARRGNIQGRHFFNSSATKHIQEAAEEFCKYIEEEIVKAGL